MLLISTASMAKEKIYYLIAVDDGTLRNTTYQHTPNLQVVADAYIHHTGMVLDTTKIFYDGRVYFQYRDVNKIFYCEMQVKSKGKYKSIKKKEKYIYAPKRK